MGISTAHGVSNIEGWESGSLVEPVNSQLATVGNVFVAAGGHNGSAYDCAVLQGGTPNYQQLPISFTAAGAASTTDKAVVVVRLYIYLNFMVVGAGGWMRIFGAGYNWNLGGTETAYIEADATQHLRINGGAASAGTLSAGSWHKLEVLLDHVNMLQVVYLDNVAFCSNTANIQAMDFLYVGDMVGAAGNSGVWLYDTLLVESSNSPLQVNIPFDTGTNLRMFQDGDSATYNLWLASVGPGKYQDADEVVPNDAADYVFSNSGVSPPDQAQEFTLQSAAAAGIALGPNDSIKAVKLQSRFRSGAGSPGFVQRLHSGATINKTSFTTASGSWLSRCSKVYQFDPDDGLDWTTADLDALEVGVEHQYNVPGTQLQCTWESLTVDFGLEFLPSIFVPAINREVVGPLELLNAPEVG